MSEFSNEDISIDLVPPSVLKVRSIQKDLNSILSNIQVVEIKLMDICDKIHEMKEPIFNNDSLHNTKNQKNDGERKGGTREVNNEEEEEGNNEKDSNVSFINVIDRLCLRDTSNELNGRIKSIIHFIDIITGYKEDTKNVKKTSSNVSE